MGGNVIIFDTKGFENATENIKKAVDKAIIAAAYRIRDNMRSSFKKSVSQYKYATPDYYRLAEGIEVGKYKKDEISVHALGHAENDGTWRTRFFVGGTVYRKNKSGKGSKGFIKANSAVEMGANNAEMIVNSFIKTAIDNA